ncbi:hypothetical protein [Pseudodesulfovibrio sp.]|uniref:hypothetical protein n=1 Tax=unclassified Pseudodesulfovibrio TaxID=2661612 RepID=UPI003B0068A3
MHRINPALRRTNDAASRLIGFVSVLRPQSVANSRVFLHATGKARRFFLVHFRKKYVRTQLSAREGNCRQCGACCNMLFTCPLLTNTGRCIAYGVCRPGSYRVFPIDQRDIDEVGKCGGRCGYNFNDRC